MTREEKRENSIAVKKNTRKETRGGERREERRGNESTKENCILFFNLLTPLSAAQKTCWSYTVE